MLSEENSLTHLSRLKKGAASELPAADRMVERPPSHKRAPAQRCKVPDPNFSELHQQNHFTTFVCQFTLKPKLWLKRSGK
jgi:hypothetical protein